MPAYTATFASGHTKSIANSKRDYRAAWRVTCTRPAGEPFVYMGFSRDRATAEKAWAREIANGVKHYGHVYASHEIIDIQPVGL